MNNIVIPTSVFAREAVLRAGQESLIAPVAASGAYGVEIRRELFADEEKPLAACRSLIEKYGLFCVYSAPVELWDLSGRLNESAVSAVLSEAKTLKAGMVKLSLGHYDPHKSDLRELTRLLDGYQTDEEPFTVTVENDQTSCGGAIEPLRAFFKAVAEAGAGVRMTFDTGNWSYCGEDAFEAADALAEHVVYVHCKHVLAEVDGLRTVPIPAEAGAPWRGLLARLPERALRAIEFALPDVKRLTYYRDLLLEA